MPGNLSFDQLKKAVADGEIDTVVVAFVDMQGRLIGKRFQAEYFVASAHEETHGCDYLLAVDIDMEPVPGYKAASWAKGYGDFVMKPDMATLRRSRGSRRRRWCSATWSTITTTNSPQPARHPEAPGGAARANAA